jgi:hypothetical protein
MFTKENVISAQFINEEHTTIEVLYTIESDEKARAYILEYDKDSEDFKDLEKAGWDLERITEETAIYKQEASRLYNEEINAAAAEMNKTNTEVAFTDYKLINHILKLNENEDIIFKSKLTIMDLDIIKKSKKTKFKQDIRKSKTLLDVIVNLQKFMNDKKENYETISKIFNVDWKNNVK